MSDVVVRQIRTWVPAAIGALLSLPVVGWLNIDPATQQALTTAVTAATIGVYYSLVTAVARKFPWVEVLLGARKQPTYEVAK